MVQSIVPLFRRRTRAERFAAQAQGWLLGLATSLAAGGAHAITIEDAVRQALESNPLVLGAAANVRAANLDIKQARGVGLVPAGQPQDAGDQHPLGVGEVRDAP